MWHFPHFTPNHTPDWDTLTARFNWLADMAAVPQDPTPKWLPTRFSGCPNTKP